MVALKHQLRLLLLLQLWSAILRISSCLFLFHSRPVVYLPGAFLATLMHFALLIGRLASCNSSARDWGNLHFIEAAAAKTDAMCSLMWNTACSVSVSTHTQIDDDDHRDYWRVVAFERHHHYHQKWSSTSLLLSPIDTRDEESTNWNDCQFGCNWRQAVDSNNSFPVTQNSLFTLHSLTMYI